MYKYKLQVAQGLNIKGKTGRYLAEYMKMHLQSEVRKYINKKLDNLVRILNM